MAQPDQVNGTEGYVAYFDILGYREMTNGGNFEPVIAALKQVKSDTLRDQKKLHACQIRMFADSVIVFCTNGDAAFVDFAVYARHLFTKMFKKGMPMRGAIAKGTFFFESELYAGRPINEAVEYANDLEFAGCVLTPSAEDLCLGPHFEIEDPVYAELDVPLKSKGRQKMYILKHDLPIDRDYVRKAFQAHGKNIPPSVMPKFNNTIEVLKKTKNTTPLPK